MFKKIALLAAAGMLLLTGCGGNDNRAEDNPTTVDEPTAASDSTKNVSYEASGWEITYEGYLIDTSLQNASTVLGYAEVETADFSKTAEEGKAFCLIKLKLKKSNSNETLKWDKLMLIDADGSEYERMEDSFISDLGMNRLPGTDLNFGENEGWICYEVDENAVGLTLNYTFEEEALSIRIN